jgi:hypothetical protein
MACDINGFPGKKMCASFIDKYLDALRVKPDVCPIDKSYGTKHFNSSTYTCRNGHSWVFTDGCKIIKVADPSMEPLVQGTVPVSEYLKEWDSINGMPRDTQGKEHEWPRHEWPRHEWAGHELPHLHNIPIMISVDRSDFKKRRRANIRSKSYEDLSIL